ncbi:MAG TPA: transcriptional regulator [Planctomycetaceae bacterium]|nr:transcriptional regulator [Planctomycetaceae bacterium]
MLRHSLDEGDQQFLQLLRSQQETTIPALCDAAGVTATAIRQRLSRLQGFGLVEREAVRVGRGRPFHRYVLTEAGHRELGDNFAELAMLLWQSVREIEEPEIRNRVLGRIRDQLARRYGGVIADRSLDARMNTLQSSLSARGFQVDVIQRNGLPVLREHHCPYHELAAVDAGICELEQQVFEAVLGSPLTLTQCCREGRGICEFQPAANE